MTPCLFLCSLTTLSHVHCQYIKLHSPAINTSLPLCTIPTTHLISELLVTAFSNSSKKVLFHDSFKTPCDGQRGDAASLEEVNNGGGI